MEVGESRPVHSKKRLFVSEDFQRRHSAAWVGLNRVEYLNSRLPPMCGVLQTSFSGDGRGKVASNVVRPVECRFCGFGVHLVRRDGLVEDA